MQHRLKDKDRTKMTATCAVCGPNVPMKMNYRGYVMCRIKWRSDMSKQRGIALEGESHHRHVERLMKAQDGLCAICQEQLSKSHLDHDHATGAVRGLLCPQCNVGLGFFRDNPAFLHSAILYLDKNSVSIK